MGCHMLCGWKTEAHSLMIGSSPCASLSSPAAAFTAISTVCRIFISLHCWAVLCLLLKLLVITGYVWLTLLDRWSDPLWLCWGRLQLPSHFHSAHCRPVFFVCFFHRLIHGIGKPDEVLECIERGVDIFESAFPYQVTERGCALSFSYDYQPDPEAAGRFLHSCIGVVIG